jgi:hypothetical protein
MAEELVEAWRFSQKGLAGYITGGHEHGIELTSGADREPVSRPMCMNLEHYFAADKLGLFVPRHKANVHSKVVGGRSVRVEIEPFEDWRLRTSITYTPVSEGAIRADYVFHFEESYKGFSALVSNYFHGSVEPWMHVGGNWIQPQIGRKEHRTWPRDAEAAKQAERRMKMLRQSSEAPKDLKCPVNKQFYDHPVIVSSIGQSGYSVVHAVERRRCPSISANRRWHAHDFSLIGQDVEKDEEIVCRAWMVYLKLNKLEEALKLANKLLR